MIKEKKRILILDGETRSALAVVRSLGKHHTCIVSSHSKHAIAFCSRYTFAHICSPKPGIAEHEYISWLSDTIHHFAIDYIIPTTENTLLKIYASDRLSEVLHRLPFPKKELFEKVTDKFLLSQTLDTYGIAYPQTQQIHSKKFDDLCREITIPFPYVIKSKRSVSHNNYLDASPKEKVSYILHRSDLEKWHASLTPSDDHEYIAQELIKGSGVGIFILIKNNTIVSSFSHKRILEKPPAGGVSVLSQSYPVNEKILEKTSSFLISIGWQGVVMIECKESNGSLVVIEINPRFWGSLQLAIDAGVNFPQDLMPGTKEHHAWNNFNPKLRVRWELGTLDHLLIRLKKNARTTMRDVLFKNALQLSHSNHFEMLRREDPAPFFQEVKNYFRNIF